MSTATREVRVRRLAHAFVAYLVLVILWGAWVRVSFSGDGCGDHWPLCHGTLVPTGDHHTAIELFHRVTSALCGPFALGLVVLAVRAFPKGHPARRAAVLALVFVLTEGLFGALLVKLRKVAYDTSIERAYLMAAHLVNTFALLLAAVGVAEARPPAPGRVSLRHRIEMVASFSLLMLVGATGAVTALGDTLFPSQSFVAGVVSDFRADAHPFLQLRAFHPIFALVTSALLLSLGARRWASGDDVTRVPAIALVALVVVQVGFGFANMVLGAPAAMQIGHLALADGVFVALSILAFRGHVSTSTVVPVSPQASNSR